MASTQQLASPESTELGMEPRQAKRRYVLYLLCALLIPGVLWLAAFPLVCSRSYEQWGRTEWGPVLEFPYQAGTPDANVVIFGDSSAFIGIDPRLVNQQLGIHSVVVPSTVGSLPVTGDAPLRAYLAHHKKPRVIVLYFSAWNLDFGHAAPGRMFEGEEMMLRHGSAAEILQFELHHPLELIAFPIRLYSTFGSTMLVEALHHRSRSADATEALGHAPFDEPYGTLQDLCRIPAPYLKQYGADSVQELRSRYQAQGMDVMVYLAPVPNCTNSGTLHDRSFAAASASPPALLPPTDFAGDAYYAHILPAQVPVASQIFAKALSEHLQQVAPELLKGAQASGPQPAQTSEAARP